jgi:hypothetical protein
MGSMNLPLEIYDLLERRLGRDDAMAVAKSIEASLTHIEERSREMAVQRKIEAKEELRIDLRSELATKEDLLAVKEDLLAVREDLAKLEGSLREDLVKLDKKFSMYFLTIIFTVIFLNQNALEFLARILGLIK